MISNMEKISLLLFIFCVHHTSGNYRLTEEEFAMMPPLISADRFSHCVNRPGGIYCTAHADVVADRPNPLHFMMVNYTNAAERHYNYTQILYGLCMTDRCKHHLKGNSTPDLMLSAESCLNETFNKKYDLGVKVEKVNCYKYKEQKHKEDYIDSIVFNVFIAIMVLNTIATAYDVIFDKKDEEGFLMSFSFRTNWRKLMAPPSSDPRITNLLGINGMRAITTALVILGHAPMPQFMTIENPHWLEESFENFIMQIMFQGHIITQTFFVISGLLLAYNLEILKETRKITWSMIPKGVFLRWIRFSPVNIAVVMISATWLRFTPYGPFWQENVGVEVNDCRAYWPSVVFYYSNYVDESFCTMQNWSMATDLHLHIIGLAIIVLAPTVKAKNRALLVFFIISLVLPALEVYFRDMDGNMLVVAHAVRYYMTTTLSFRHMYQRTHTNMSSFIIGMYFGYIVYEVHRKPVAETTKKRLSFLYWLLFPVMVAMTSLTFPLFLTDGPRAPVWWRVLFAVTQKPLFGFFVALVILGLVVRVEKIPIYRWVLESNFWTPISKISYSAFAVHAVVIRYYGGRKATLSYVSLIHVFQNYVGILVTSVVFGFFLYMLVEAPFSQIFKYVFVSGPKIKGKVWKDINQNGAHINGKSVVENRNSMSNGNIISEVTKLTKAE